MLWNKKKITGRRKEKKSLVPKGRLTVGILMCCSLPGSKSSSGCILALKFRCRVNREAHKAMRIPNKPLLFETKSSPLQLKEWG